MESNARKTKILTNILNDFVSLFFPHFCLGCQDSLVKGEDILCTNCILNLPVTNYHLQDSNPIKERLMGRLPIENALAFLKFTKGGSIQHLLHQLKYNNHPEIAVFLGKIYGRILEKVVMKENVDIIIPVPLHPSRKLRRGYNQSAKFAEGLSSSMQIKFDDSLCKRMIKTKTQTRKSRIDRWENVRDTFSIKDENKIKDKNILLVDDVVTTGATIEALGEKIIEVGCKSLSIVCLAEAQ